ncbi:hypothetical protein V1509DRAFT_624530 [Lipomyces kononenkoae]
MLAMIIGVILGFAKATNITMTENQAIDKSVDCLLSCDQRYNYTIGYNNQLIIQPYEKRGIRINAGEIDRKAFLCIYTFGFIYDIAMSNNGLDEEDLRGSVMVEAQTRQLFRDTELLKRRKPNDEIAIGSRSNNYTRGNHLQKRTGIYDVHPSDFKYCDSADLHRSC